MTVIETIYIVIVDVKRLHLITKETSTMVSTHATQSETYAGSNQEKGLKNIQPTKPSCV